MIVAAEQIRSLPEDFGVVRRLREFECGVARSHDTRNMADTPRSLLAQDGGVQELLETEDLGACAASVAWDCSNSTADRFRSQRLGAEAVRQEPSDSCRVNFIKISADLGSQLEIVSEVQGSSPVLARRTAATHSIVGPFYGVDSNVSTLSEYLRSVLQFSNVHLDSSPIEVQRADALYDSS